MKVHDQRIISIKLKVRNIFEEAGVSLLKSTIKKNLHERKKTVFTAMCNPLLHLGQKHPQESDVMEKFCGHMKTKLAYTKTMG